MQHRQKHQLFYEVFTPYSQEKYSTSVHKQRLNAIILYYIMSIHINYQRPIHAVTKGQQTSEL